jgi:MFS family permease
MSMPWPALLADVWSQTHSDNWLGLTGAARFLPYVLLSAAAGILADRFRRTSVLRSSALTRAVLLVGCVVLLRSDQLALAVLLAVLAVAAGTPAYPAAVASMPQLAGDRAERMTSLLVTVEVTAFVIGPALGGLLLGLGDGWWSVLLSAVVGALGVPFLVGLDSGKIVVETDPDVRGRLRTVLSSVDVAAAIVAVALVNFTESAASVALLSLSHEHWRDGDRGFGIATAALGFGSLAAPLVGLLMRLRGALLVNAVGLTAAGAAPGVLVAAGPLVLAGAAGTVVECVSTDVLQQRVPDRVRAFSLGLTDSIMVLAAAVGALLAPHLTSRLGPVLTFAGLGALLVTAVLTVGRLRTRPARAKTPQKV